MARFIDTGDMSVELLTRAQRMLEHCDVVNVRPLSFSAVRHEASSDVARADVASQSSYSVNAQSFGNKFDWTVRLLDDAEELVAEMSASIVIDYLVSDDFEPDDDAAEHIASTTGYMAAYPYARELFESVTCRMQLDPLVLGLLRLSDLTPRSMSTVSSDGSIKQMTPAKD